MNRKIWSLAIILSIVIAGSLLVNEGGQRQIPEIGKPAVATGLSKHEPTLHSKPADAQARRSFEAKRSFVSPEIPEIRKLQIPFIANQGQLDERVKFYASALGMRIFVTDDGHMEYESLKGNPIKEILVGGTLREVKGEKEASTKVGYFKGNDPSKWKSDIPVYEGVSLGEVYDGVELKLHAYGDNVEKLFYVKPEAAPENIRLRVEGARELQVTGKGELEITTDTGTVRFTKPTAYQEIKDANGDTKTEYVEVAYVVDRDEYGFELGNYDRNRELIIDPLLASTFFSGSGDDVVSAMTVDKEGFVYISGTTSSSDLPTTLDGNHMPAAGDADGFVAKLSSDLKTLVALTYIGGSSGDGLRAIGIDSGGNVFVAGSSSSTNFPTTAGAHSITFNGGVDGIVVKLSSNLSLLSSTYVGGNAPDGLGLLTIDTAGYIFVAGYTSSDDIPVPPGVYDNALGAKGHDALVVKLDNDLGKIVAATYLDGTKLTELKSIAIGASGDLYVAGITESADFPTSAGAYGNTCGPDPNGFVSRFDPELTTLQASTCIGGTNIDRLLSMAMDGSGNVIVAGYTFSKDFPVTSGAYRTTPTDIENIFVSKLSGDLTSLLSSSFLASDFFEEPDKILSDLQVDAGGNVYVAGATSSKNFPVSADAFDVTCGADGLCNKSGGAGVGPISLTTDAYISVLSGDLTTLVATTYFGGSESSRAQALALDPDGNILVAGHTTSSDLPTTMDAYQPQYRGSGDAFIAKFDPKLSSGVIRKSLSVTRAGAGSGGVNSIAPGVSCGTTCSALYVGGEMVTLRAKADIGSAFLEWGGACSGTRPLCTLKMDSDKTVTATFMKFDPEISVRKTAVAFGKNHINQVARKRWVRIKNVGKGILTISGISVDSPEFMLGNWDGATVRQLKPKESFTLAVNFAPTSVGEKTATLTITSDDPENPTKTVTLVGTGK